MTVDLYGSGGSGPQLGFQPLYTVCPQRQGLLHIDAGKAVPAQQYNRFDRLFRALGLRKTAVILAFDTPVSPPYKRGSHGERGVPKTSRVLAAKGFATQMVRSPAGGLDRRSCVLCIVCLERDTPAAASVSALTFGLSADVFVVASSMLNCAPVKVRCWASNLVTGSQKLPLLLGEAGSTLNLRV